LILIAFISEHRAQEYECHRIGITLHKSAGKRGAALPEVDSKTEMAKAAVATLPHLHNSEGANCMSCSAKSKKPLRSSKSELHRECVQARTVRGDIDVRNNNGSAKPS
jgi:hypothetical protein